MSIDSVRPTRAQIDLGAIRHNCTVLRALLRGGTQHLAVVKANGYGHGAVEVATACLQAGVDHLGVALVEEGIRLRLAGIDAPVLVLAEPLPEAAGLVVRYDLTPTVWSLAGGRAVAEAAGRAGMRHRVHVAVDTGMRREGVDLADAVELFRRLAGMPGLLVEGVWTHLAAADDPEHPVTDVQLDRFRVLVEELRGLGLRPEIVHAANSPATIARPDTHFDLVRTGIAIYGLAPSQALRGRVDLRPAMRVVSRVAVVRRVRAGEGVGYGHTYVTASDTDLAVVPVGYGDGFSRLLSNSGQVLIRGVRRPVAGRVSMDQTTIDCGIGGAEVGDEVVLLGRQDHDEITADEIAGRIGTINYEVVTSIGPRVPRVYLS